MHDQIEDFKEFISENALEKIRIRIPVIPPPLIYNFSSDLSAIEACCYFGSVNIFYFIITNLAGDVSEACLQLALIGGNTDIINECMKHQNLNPQCLKYAILSHNNKFLEYIFERDSFTLQDLDSDAIISSNNLKAVFLMFEKERNSVFPWCMAFPQIKDILQNEEVDYSKVTIKGWNCLDYVMVNNNREVCDFLINSSTIEKIYCQRHLFQAAKYNFIEIIKFLVSHGININSKDSAGKTALHYATEKNNKEIVEFLISQGANVLVKDKNGSTLLHSAAMGNCKEITELLISKGAIVDATSVVKETPLIYSIVYNSLETMKVLISHGANVNNKTYLLRIAKKFNRKEIAEFLNSLDAKTSQPA